MGFIKNLMKTEKQPDEDEDPDWAELKKFRDSQKRRLGGLVESRGAKRDSIDSDSTSWESRKKDKKNQPEDDDLVYPDDDDDVPTSTLRMDPKTPAEYQCTQCELKLKESWNRCPKCGGEIKPIGLDTSEDIKEKYPDRISERSASNPEERKPTAPTGGDGRAESPVPIPAAPGKKVKKIRKVRKAGNQIPPGTRTVSSSHPSPIPAPSAVRRRIPPPPSRATGPPSRDHDLDDLFTDDPMLDDRTIKPKESNVRPGSRARKKVSWKDVPPVVDHSEPAHKPPAEVKSMLDDLMDSGSDQPGTAGDGGCPKCGFKNPSGEWDFCMGCGEHF